MKRVAANYDYMRGADDVGNPPSIPRGKYQQDIDEIEARNQNIHDEEAREMAEAATKTVQTLNVMLGQKKQQLENKDTHIESLRQQLADLRAQGNQKYMKLQHDYNEMTRKNSDLYSKYAGSSAPQKDTIPAF
jgi:chromosome segregation ATPase